MVNKCIIDQCDRVVILHVQFHESAVSVNYQKGTMEKAGDEDFGATLGNGNASYRMGKVTKKGIQDTVIEVDSQGKLSGYTLNTRLATAETMKHDSQQAKDQISQVRKEITNTKKLKKLRDKLHKRGDEIAKTVSGQNMADYKQGKQSYATVSGNEYFKKQTPEVEKAYNSASQTNKEIAGVVNDTFKQLTPNEASRLLVLEKLQEQKQK